MKNLLTVGIFAGLLMLDTAGSALAENTNGAPILSTDQFSFSATVDQNGVPMAEKAGNSEVLAQVGTEAGNWQFRYDAPETQADLAAKNYHYDAQKLRMVGTEFGYDAYIHTQGLNCPLC